MNRIIKHFLLIIFIASNQFSANSIYYYTWPISPFNSQHQINATFGECRSKTVDGILISRHHIHTGIDIAGPEGTEVRPTITGKVSIKNATVGYVQVKKTIDNITYYFEYHHLKNIPSSVVEGSTVYEGVTPLGYINSLRHLHYVDGGSGFTVRNPLKYMHPYLDEREPVFSMDRFLITLDMNASTADDYLATNYFNIQAGEKIDIIVHAWDEIQTYDEKKGLYWFYLEVKNSLNEPVFGKSQYFQYWADGFRPNVKLVYAPGSNTSNYLYNLTNEWNYSLNDYWDTSDMAEGQYTVWVDAYDIGYAEYSSGQIYIFGHEISDFAYIYVSGSAAESSVNNKKGVTNEN